MSDLRDLENRLIAEGVLDPESVVERWCKPTAYHREQTLQVTASGGQDTTRDGRPSGAATWNDEGLAVEVNAGGGSACFLPVGVEPTPRPGVLPASQADSGRGAEKGREMARSRVGTQVHVDDADEWEQHLREDAVWLKVGTGALFFESPDGLRKLARAADELAGRWDERHTAQLVDGARKLEADARRFCRWGHECSGGSRCGGHDVRQVTT